MLPGPTSPGRRPHRRGRSRIHIATPVPEASSGGRLRPGSAGRSRGAGRRRAGRLSASTVTRAVSVNGVDARPLRELYTGRAVRPRRAAAEGRRRTGSWPRCRLADEDPVQVEALLGPGIGHVVGIGEREAVDELHQAAVVPDDEGRAGLGHDAGGEIALLPVRQVVIDRQAEPQGGGCRGVALALAPVGGGRPGGEDAGGSRQERLGAGRGVRQHGRQGAGAGPAPHRQGVLVLLAVAVDAVRGSAGRGLLAVPDQDDRVGCAGHVIRPSPSRAPAPRRRC